MQLELKALQREVGITFVYVTHDQEEALTMSDVIVVMRDGLIQQLGAPESSTSGRSTASSPTSSAARTSSRGPPARSPMAIASWSLSLTA